MEITETFFEGTLSCGTYCGNLSEMSWTSEVLNSKYPCIIWIENSEKQPRTNNPRIKFCVDKHQITAGDNPMVERIPLMICDDPYIPDSHKHIKHNWTEELELLKEWVKTYKEQLLQIGEGTLDYLDLFDIIETYPGLTTAAELELRKPK